MTYRRFSFPACRGMTALGAALISGLCGTLMNVVLLCAIARADTDEYLKGVPPSDVSEWRYHGIGAEESRKWIREGIIFAAWAAQWRDEGFSAESAGKWRQIANVYTAGDFLKNGFGPEEAKEWIDSGIHSGLRAREYLAVGLRANEAQSFWKAGLYPEQVKEWRDAGFDAEAILQWRYGERESAFYYTKDSPFARTVYKLDMAIEWRDAGFEPRHAHMSRVYGVDLAEAIRWREAGFSFDDAVKWKDSGFMPEEAVVHRGRGMSHVDAELKRYDESDGKEDEITSLDIDVTVNRNGTLDVIETITVIDRPGGAYTDGYYWPLPQKEHLRSLRSLGFSRSHYSHPGFHVKSVEVDGVPGEYYVSDGRLAFGNIHSPLQEGTHVIRLSYTTDSRILDEPHHDEIYFGIVKDNRKGRFIRSAMATIRLPKGADVMFTDGIAGLSQRKDFISSVEETGAGDTARFSLTRPLKKGMDFAVNVGFIKGYVNEGRLHKLDQLDRRVARLLSSLAIFVLGFAVSFSYYLIAWLRVGRDPKSPGAPVAEFSPPDDIDPSAMRALHAKGRTDYLSLAAEIIYLAERGSIAIFEREGAYTIETVKGEGAHLPPSAREFCAAFFGQGSTVVMTHRAKSKELSHAAHTLKAFLKGENRKQRVSNLRYLWPGMILSVLSLGAALALIDYRALDGGKAAAVLPFYAAFLAAAFGGMSFVFKRLLRTASKESVFLRQRIASYQEFLARNFSGCSAPRFIPPLLHKHLPYACAAGIDVRDLMIRKGEAKWYHGTSGGFGCAEFLATVRRSL